MERIFIVKWVLILSAGAILDMTASSSPQDHSRSPFPVSVLNELSLQHDEVPPGYGLLNSTNLLEQAGLSQNPDYLTRRTHLADAIQMNTAHAAGK